ncbi:ArfGap-domain-containing protein [Rhodotorula sp. JG-1b]|nr:ArfGap-domain-containing protein [Rhodotorula sp. JG-1b]
MSQRYTQDRATTQRHLALLKELLKQPDNKLCADCKRNDPRWASTNLGCWLCIRCSGHHRGMGVHISRVRSVDLDTWTREQIEHMQRWGNRRANLYWEAHLKPGHMPPDHKIDSFIRSKYELKRWAMDGPIPEPEALDASAASVSPHLCQEIRFPLLCV